MQQIIVFIFFFWLIQCLLKLINSMKVIQKIFICNIYILILGNLTNTTHPSSIVPFIIMKGKKKHLDIRFCHVTGHIYLGTLMKLFFYSCYVCLTQKKKVWVATASFMYICYSKVT